MNETLNTIFTRRSVRKYKPDPIPHETMETITEAGLYAPTAMGRQPWHVLVISNLEKIKELNAEVKSATASMPDNPYRDYVVSDAYTINYHAPIFVVVSGDTVLSPRNAQFDCALLLGNMFLAAHSLGIGSCWINQLNVLNDEPEFRDYITKLGVPVQNRIFGCACFGYPDTPTKAPAQRKEKTVMYIE